MPAKERWQMARIARGQQFSLRRRFYFTEPAPTGAMGRRKCISTKQYRIYLVCPET